MVRFSALALCTLSAFLSLAKVSDAQQNAYAVLPDNVQAVIWIPNGDQLVERWDRTQLAKLAADPTVRPFFDDQRQALEERFIDAGWRLNITPEDLSQFSEGQIALAWMEKADTPRKPFALAMLAGVEDDAASNKRLMQVLDKQLSERKPDRKETLQHLGVSIAKYTMPKRADQLLAEDSYYAITKGQLVVTDDEPLMRDLLGRILGQQVVGRVLAEDPVFIEGRAKAVLSNVAQVEYFVRPLGIARVLRSIGGKRSKSNADMLAVLQNQGFSAIKCVCGEIVLGEERLDMRHRGFVLADRPLPGSAGILDFPNAVTHEVPSFVGKEISSLMATNWNAKEAFWKSEGLVDELAGTPGVFAEVIEGIKKDPNGPRIDIAVDVLPQLTNDIYSMADSAPGKPDVNSRRNLIAIRVKDSDAMAKVLDRAMRNEPDAELVAFGDLQIWQVIHRDDELVIDLEDDFGEFGGGAPADQEEVQPWLSNWAITVYDGYLMFASHIEMIQEAIQQAKTAERSPLESEPDYQRVMAAVAANFGQAPSSAWRVVRNSLAHRVQYELFREGKLKDSQSMLATLLDRLLQSNSEIKLKEQVVKGSNLPPFETISHFLQPSGVMFRSTEGGWEFGGLLLAADMQNPATQPIDKTSSSGTARANSEAEANR